MEIKHSPNITIADGYLLCSESKLIKLLMPKNERHGNLLRFDLHTNELSIKIYQDQ